jgi:uncharacterized protein DUF5946
VSADREAYDALCGYTLSHPDPAFLHQHVVDAFAAQHASEQTKAIQLAFSVVGLYLHVERRFTGRQVQRAHMQLARRERAFPSLAIPAARGAFAVADVMAAAEGPERDAAIDAWCAAVWDAYRENGPAVVEYLRRNGIL